MTELYNTDAPKKAANLSVNSDLLARSKSLGINLSATLEQALKDKLAQKAIEKWREENKGAIRAYNDFVSENGCFSDDYRDF